MKLNKKGFMLAEVVIVASVIATVLVFLYISINRMSNAYDKRNRYYDIDAMYAAMEINDIIKKDTSINSDSNIIPLDSGNYSIFTDFYKNATSYKKINAWYCPNNSSTSINTNNDDTLKDYISYLREKLEEVNYNYLVIVELIKETDDVYFYTLKVGDTSETQS